MNIHIDMLKTLLTGRALYALPLHVNGGYERILYNTLDAIKNKVIDNGAHRTYKLDITSNEFLSQETYHLIYFNA